ncbi:MAG: type II TA system antitoxin MqsA family protein [Christensenellales bacterium]
MKRTEFCINCGTRSVLKDVEKNETFYVGSDKTKIDYIMKYHVCSKCGENLTSFKDIDIQMANIYKKYREIKNLLQPEEIKGIRNKYGISAELFSKILGLGRKTITTYENGVFQTKANDMLIRQSADKCNFIKMFELRKNDLSEKEIQTIERKLKNQVGIFSATEYEFFYTQSESKIYNIEYNIEDCKWKTKQLKMA